MKRLILFFVLVSIAIEAMVAQSGNALLYESFDTIATGVPSGWIVGGTAQSLHNWQSTDEGYNQSRGLHFDSWMAGSGSTATLKAPTISLPAGTPMTLTFKYRNYSQATLAVYISTDGGATYASQLASNLVTANSTDWGEGHFGLGNWAGSGNVRIVVEATALNGMEGVFLDEFQIEATATCKHAENLSVNSITSNSATLSWQLSADGMIPDPYEYVVTGENGDTVRSCDTLHTVTNTVTVTGLAPNSSYTFRMRGNCTQQSAAYSSWTTTEFRTLCIAEGVPYEENFDSLSALPSCSFSENCRINTNAAYSYGVAGHSLSLNPTEAEWAYFIVQPLAIRADNMEVGFKIRRETGTAPIYYHVGTVDDPADLSTFASFKNDTLGAGTEWKDMRFNSASTGETRDTSMVCIYVESTAGGSVFVDDLSVEEIPSCLRPEDFVCRGMTDSTVTLGWSTTNATSVELTVNGVSRRVSGNPYTVTGLAENTPYSFRIRGVCGAGDTSRWASNTVTVTTPCSTRSTPYFAEDFDDLTKRQIPGCWMTGYMDAMAYDTRAQAFVTDETYKHGSAGRSMKVGGAANNAAYLTTQAIAPGQGDSIDLSVWVYRSATPSATEGIRIYATRTPTDTTGAEMIAFIPRCMSEAPYENTAGWRNYQYPIATRGQMYIMVVGIYEGDGETYFDDLAVVQSPACRKVRNITFDAQSGTLGWSAGGTETQWEVRYTLTSDQSVVEDTTVTVSSNTYSITATEPEATYTVAGCIRALCGAAGGSDSVDFARTFTTDCSATAPPYSQDFEGTAFPPACWQTVAPSTTNWAKTAAEAHSGRYAARVGTSGATEDESLVMPAMTLDGSKQYEVVFWVYRQDGYYAVYQNEAIHVIVGETPTDTTNATEIGTVAAHYQNYPAEAYEGWYRYTYQIPAGTSGVKYIRFQFHNMRGAGTYIDDVKVREVPTCAEIAGGCRVRNVTDSTAVVKITDSTVSGWQVAYTTVEGQPTMGRTTSVGSGSSTTLSNLAAGTVYYVYVRRECQTEESDWSEETVLNTYCAAKSVPFTETFEGFAAGAGRSTAMECHNQWSETGKAIEVKANGGASANLTYNHTESGTKGLWSEQSGEAAVLTRVHLQAGENYKMSIWVKAKEGTAYASYGYRAVLLTGTTDETSSMTRMDSMDVTTSEFTKLSSYITVAAEGDYYVGFATYGLSSTYTIYADDWSVVTENCIPPTATLVTNLSTTTATVNLTSESTRWEMYVSKSENPQTNPTYHSDSIGTKAVNFDNLEPNTQYYYMVRSLCDSVTASEWTEVRWFRTACGAEAIPYTEGFETPEDFGCWRVFDEGRAYNTDSVSHQGMRSVRVQNTSIVTPQLGVTSLAPYTAEGWLYTEGDSVEVMVGVMVDRTDASTYQDLETFTIASKGEWYEFSCDFGDLGTAAYAAVANAQYVVFSVMGSETVWMDDLEIDVTPSCPKPSQGTVSNVTSATAEVGWQQNGEESQWEVRAIPTDGGAEIKSITSTNPVTITGLEAATTYRIEIRAICEDGDTSSVLSAGRVRTECTVMALPYECGFERSEGFTATNGYVSGALEEQCWATLNDSQSIPYYTVDATSYSTFIDTGRQSMLMVSGNAPLYLIMPEFTTALGSTRLRFDHINMGSGTSYGTLEVGYITDVTDTGTYTARYTLGQPTSYTAEDLTFSSTPAGARIAFRYSAPYRGYRVGIDNIRVTEVRSCGEPNGVSVTDVTESAATVRVSDTSHQQWEYACIESGGKASGATWSGMSVDTVRLSALRPATDYEVYVRAICQAGDTSNHIHRAFRTRATAAATPYVCDFGAESENGNWTLTDDMRMNHFVIGNDPTALHGAAKALYITNDETSHAYSTNVASASAAYRPIAFGAGRYEISVEYRCTGGESGADGARLYLAREDAGVTLPTSATNWQTGVTALDNGSMISNDNTGWRVVSKVVDFTTHPGVYNLVAAWYNNGTNGVQEPVTISRIEVREQSCDTVTGVSVTGTTTNSVTFSCSTTADSVSYAVSATDNIADSICTGRKPASAPITAGGLATGTEYRLFVRAECTGGSHSIWTSTAFATECSVIDTFPVTEGFESGLFAPRCWSCTAYASAESQIAGTGGWARHYSNQNDGYEATGYGSARMVGGTSGATSILASPQLELEAGRDYNVSLSMYHTTQASGAQLKVYLARSNTTTAGGTLIGSIDTYDAGLTANGMLAHSMDITNVTGGRYYLLMEGIAGKYENVYIDDISVTAYPACRELTGSLTAATSMSSARITSSEAMAYEVAYAVTTASVSIEDTIASVGTTDGMVTVTGLTAGTQYTMFARRVCGEDGRSEWRQMNNFTTKSDDCYAPDNIECVGTVGSESVVIAWNGAPEATGYEYRVTQGSATVDSGVTTSDTLRETGLAASTPYTLYVRTVCQPGDTTAWARYDFSTNAVSSAVPFHTGFESVADNALWEVTQSGDVNNFAFGVSAEGVYEGQRGLYISDDGTSYGMSLPGATTPRYTTSENVAYIKRVLRIDTAGDYEAELAWRCHALKTESWIEVFGRAFIAPHGAVYTADATTYRTAVPEGGFEIGRIEQQQAWTEVSSIVTLTEPGLYDLVFMWFAENQYGYATADCIDDFPLAIDEVSVRRVRCRPVVSVSMINVTDTSAKAVLNKVVGADVEYALMETADSISSEEISTLQSSGYSDTLQFAGLTPGRSYRLAVRTVCDTANRSEWLTTEFKTLMPMGRLPYVCNFEDTTENSQWSVGPNEQRNRFRVGTDVYESAQRSLYISDDSVVYHYTTGSGNRSISYATRNFALEAGNYEYSYDWKCEGYSLWDYGRVMLIPTSYEIEQGTAIAGLDRGSAPTGAIVMDGGTHLDGQSSWQHKDGIFTLTEGGTYYLTIYWENGTVAGGSVPMAVDNITLKEVSCFPVSMTVDQMSVTSSSADVVVSNANAGADVVYTLATIDSHVNVVSRDTMRYRGATDTLHLTGLSGSANYYLYAMATCSATDSSLWRKTTFQTSCGTVSVLPYVQDFESMNTTSTYENVIGNICWSALNVQAGGGTYPYYRIISTGTYVHGGVRALDMTSSKSNPLYMVLPEFDSINDLRLSLYYRTYSKSTSNGTISLGYMSDATDASSFVSLQQLGKTITFTEASQAYTSAPAHARIAIRYTGAANNYDAYVDDIRVTRMVKAASYRDTLCNGADYTANGFNVTANHLTVGDNTLTRIVAGSSFYAEDTIITAVVYVRPQIQSEEYDTICTGEAYNKGSWSIAQPQSRTYTQVYSSVTGCDSSSVLHLYVSPGYQIMYDTICRGSYYTFHGRQITAAGMYVDSALNRQGCMQRDTLYLAVEGDTVRSVESICEADIPYTWCGMSLTKTGAYDITTQSARGCTVYNHLDLTVYMNDSTFSASICQGGLYQFRDTVIEDGGSYDITRINGAGCYTTYHLTVTEQAVREGNVYDNACEGYAYNGYGITALNVTSDTTVDVRSQTAERCDSITHVHITYIRTVYSDTFAAIKSGESFTWYDQTYNQTGDYQEVLSSQVTGCDSVVTLHLHVKGAGVEEAEEGVEITIVPNPVKVNGTAVVYCSEQIVGIEVLNAYGQLVYESDGGSNQIPGMAAAGVYYIRVTVRGGKRYSGKVIVE